MSNDVIGWDRGEKRNNSEDRNQNDQTTGNDVPGDMDAPDIVGRTGEEMPEVAHDDGDGEYPDDAVGAAPEHAVPRKPDSVTR